MKTLIIAQILTTFMTLIWFDVLSIDTRIKVLLGYKKWTSKVEMRRTWHRVFACYFCTSFWLGVIAALILLSMGETTNAILLIMSNAIVSRVLDILLGFKSV